VQSQGIPSINKMVDLKFRYMLEQPQKIGVLTMEKSSIHEVNQQVTETELAWLGGIIDGEGSIGINGRRNGKFNLCPVMQLSNTSPNMINKVISIFERMGIKHYIQTHHLSYANPNHQDIYKVIIGRLSQMKLFLEAVIPYLVVKDGQAKMTLRFVNSRLSNGARPGNPNFCPYTEEERKFAEIVNQLNCESNHRLRKSELESSTTIRETALVG